jgi:hypothetical protein
VPSWQEKKEIKRFGKNRMKALSIYIMIMLFRPLLADEGAIKNDSIDLGPLYEPDAVRFSFETAGWYVLSGLLLLLAVLLFLKWFKRYRENAYRREALKNLAIIEDKFSGQQDVLCLNDVLILLKRVAIQAFGRQQVAQLYGYDWLVFLESKGKNTPFTQYKHNIINTLYDTVPVKVNEIEDMMELSKRWIKTHA